MARPRAPARPRPARPPPPRWGCPARRGSGGRAASRSCSRSGLLVQAGARVVRDLVVGTEIVPVGALRCGEALRALHSPAEAPGGRAQRQLRVDLELARHVDGREEHVADLVEGLLARAGGPQLLELALDGLVGHVLEVEARGGGAALDLARVQRRSEERRVGKECRSRWSPYQYKKERQT